MEFIKPGTHIDFIGKRKYAFSVSLFLILMTVVMLIVRGGPNYGVDFTGGVMIQVKFSQKVSTEEIRSALGKIQLQDSMIQHFGSAKDHEFLIRAHKTDVEMKGFSDKVLKALSARFGKGVEIRRAEMVGPKVGASLRQKALFAIFYAILLIAIYISGRFEFSWVKSIVMAACLAFVVYIASSFGLKVTWLIIVALLATLALCWALKLKYALGAIVALVHDITITVGAFALTNRQVSLTIIAALLTILGYSLNDTIVVFDRIRENARRYRRRDFREVMNTSINETLSRTILTAGTVFLVVVALFFLGGSVIHDFAFAMMVGTVVGTYSSIFVASPIILIWEGRFSGKSKSKGDAK